MIGGEPFLVHPRNLPTLQGESRELASARDGLAAAWLLLFLLPFLLVGAWMSLSLAESWLHEDSLRTHGLHGVARVIAHEARPLRASGPWIYALRLRSATPAMAFETTQRVREGTWRSLATGSRVPIVYLADQPASARLEREPGNPDLPFFTVFAAGWDGFVLLFTGLIARRVRAHWRLLRGFEILEGRVTEAHLFQKGKGNRYLTLSYRAAGPTGREVDGCCTLLRNDLDAAQVPAPGTPVAIAYRTASLHTAL